MTSSPGTLGEELPADQRGTKLGSAVGQSVSHESANAHVAGSARFTDDLWPLHRNVLHLWPCCAPHAHATIIDVDVAAARAAPGVVDILLAADIPGDNDIGPARRDEPLIPERNVSFYGQVVAWVAAESEAQARAAVARISVQYAPLPAVLTLDQAIAERSTQTERLVLRKGLGKLALGRAPHRLQGQLRTGAQEHFYLETQAALAYRDESQALVVQSSTQHPSETQAMVARVLGCSQHEVVVQCLRMGGAFGGKEVQATSWAAIAALACVRNARPARVRLTRKQDFSLTGKRHPFLGAYDVGFDEQGRICALSIELASDGGHCLDLSAPVMQRALLHSDGCYDIPHMQVEGQVYKTHTTSSTAFRGFGGPQGMLVVEEVLDRVARALALDVEQVRRRNFYRGGGVSHFGQEIVGAERLVPLWDELKQTSDWETRRGQIECFNAQHADAKRGLAIVPVKFGISFTTAAFNQAGALVLIYRDGSVQVNHGGTEMGQGLHTKVQQVAAAQLGLPLASIRMMPTRTDKVPNTSATAASAGSDLNGAAVIAACKVLRERLEAVATQRLGRPRGAWRFFASRVFDTANEAHGLAFHQLVERAYQQRVALFSSGFFRTPKIAFNWETGRGTPFHYFAFGAAVSEVEVSRFTGQFFLRRVDILHDVGRSLSPGIDRGQIEGGFVQGVGWLTTEQLHYDEVGRLATTGASTYKLPTIAECPPDFRVSLLTDATHSRGLLGSKAVGEPPLMLAMSVREALREAVAAFRPGARAVELLSPATPENIFWAIRGQRAP